MHYLIDGHNLIARIPDIDLADPDDEVRLVLRLRGWTAAGRKRRVTVVFDQGLPGGEERLLSTGPVKVIFAPAGKTADSVLISRIRRVRNPREYTLISSDRRILDAAGGRGMPSTRSEEFAPQLAPSPQHPQPVVHRYLREASAVPIPHDQIRMGKIQIVGRAGRPASSRKPQVIVSRPVPATAKARPSS